MSFESCRVRKAKVARFYLKDFGLMGASEAAGYGDVFKMLNRYNTYICS